MRCPSTEISWTRPSKPIHSAILSLWNQELCGGHRHSFLELGPTKASDHDRAAQAREFEVRSRYIDTFSAGIRH